MNECVICRKSWFRNDNWELCGYSIGCFKFLLCLRTNGLNFKQWHQCSQAQMQAMLGRKRRRRMSPHPSVPPQRDLEEVFLFLIVILPSLFFSFDNLHVSSAPHTTERPHFIKIMSLLWLADFPILGWSKAYQAHITASFMFPWCCVLNLRPVLPEARVCWPRRIYRWCPARSVGGAV